ncbi:MAG: MMPL family transporter [Candidatus Omnitrophica bacterium]|nr:MMPL family transporter [Candidatus Omnitrophota bacterium]
MLKAITAALKLKFILIILLTAANIFVIAKYIDLTPQVDQNFFFSSHDPQAQAEGRISKIFKRQDDQLIISAEGKIDSPLYLKKVEDLSAKINALPQIISVISLATGPGDFATGLKSPLWRRLLIADDQKSTNIIAVLPGQGLEENLTAIEKLVNKASGDNFRLRISGAPYITKLIQKNLVRDFRLFTLLTFLVFAGLMLFIFRSWSILLGTLLACLNAAMLTIIAAKVFNIKIGLLTANLTTITFVLTLSHIIFLTYNWKHLAYTSGDQQRIKKSIQYTLSPSFWSMFTTLLGFLSLITVPAKPLRELGISGALGAIIAMACAYLIYPLFLSRVQNSQVKNDYFEESEQFIYQKVKVRKKAFRLILIGLSILLLPGLAWLKNDPSIFSYFKKSDPITEGLRYIDQSGGSNPLIIVVKTESGNKLNNTKSYNQLWQLQTALEKHQAVGSVISLPVLMAQARQHPFSFFLGWDWLLNIMEKPSHNEIGKIFISPDRKNGLFLLRMKETGRTKTRLEIIAELKELVRENGFVPEITGGVYALQGRLAKLVSSSLVFGLFRLLFIFFLISWLVSRSLPVSLSMTLGILIIPLISLGAIGLIGMPLDIVAAPSLNVAIAIGIDTMIHMVKYWRRIKAEEKTTRRRWEKVRTYLWNPVFNTLLIIGLGFGVFLFSQFPPTQRFGGIIIAGSLMAALIALYLMPWFICNVFTRKTCEA